MKFTLILSCFIFSTIGNTALAGGTFIGNGGHVVACFSEKFQDAFFENGGLSQRGLTKVESLDVLDYYIAKKNFKGQLVNNELPGLCELNNRDMAFAIWDRLWDIDPRFHETISCTQYESGLNYGIPVQYELHLVLDNGEDLQLPENCSLRQAVVRQGSFFYYNKNLMEHLQGLTCVPQRGLLRLHEDIYTSAVRAYGHETSLQSRKLLTALLLNSPATVKEVIKDFGRPIGPACFEEDAL